MGRYRSERNGCVASTGECVDSVLTSALEAYFLEQVVCWLADFQSCKGVPGWLAFKGMFIEASCHWSITSCDPSHLWLTKSIPVCCWFCLFFIQIKLLVLNQRSSLAYWKGYVLVDGSINPSNCITFSKLSKWYKHQMVARTTTFVLNYYIHIAHLRTLPTKCIQ